jgi:hypothetical protein
MNTYPDNDDTIQEYTEKFTEVWPLNLKTNRVILLKVNYYIDDQMLEI